MPSKSRRRSPAPQLEFEQIASPPFDTALTLLRIEGADLDLRDQFQFVGLTYGVEEASAMLGWAAMQETMVERNGRSSLLSGLALTMSEVSRCEVSFPPAAEGKASPGPLDYFELRRDPEPTLVFFFEHGSIRLSGARLRGEVLLDETPSLPVIQ